MKESKHALKDNHSDACAHSCAHYDGNIRRNIDDTCTHIPVAIPKLTHHIERDIARLTQAKFALFNILTHATIFFLSPLAAKILQLQLHKQISGTGEPDVES
jgi:hypothetical protein